MTTESTQKRLLDAAERLFAENGYDGASLRCITSEAGVDLGSVRYHFGCKEELFKSVLKRRLDPLCEERLRRLEAVQAAHGEHPPVEAIIRAFLEPAVQLARDEEHGALWMKLIGRVRLEPGQHMGDIREEHRRRLEHFLGAFRRALPGLPEQELANRFYFLFMNIDATLRAIASSESIGQARVTPGAMVDHLVRFVEAGMSAAPTHSGDPLTRASSSARGSSKSSMF